MKSYDLVIVGAGLVGTSLATALKDSGLSILMLEHHLLDTSKPINLQSRPISLAHSSIESLKQMDLWSQLAATSTPIKHVHVSEQGRFGRLRISASDYELDALGYVLPFDSLRHTLYQASCNSGAEILSINQLIAIEQQDNQVLITVNHAGKQQTIAATRLIGADGNHSQTRELLGIGVQQTDHNEQAITATLKLNKQLDTGYERFTKNGIVAVLPRQDQYAGLVITTATGSATDLDHWSDQQLLDCVTSTLGSRIGPVEQLTRGACYPLISQTAQQQYYGQALLLGNSAHSFYPIAAQGFNLSLRDTMCLVACINYAQQHKDYASEKLYSTYLHHRIADQKRVQQLVGMTASLFDLQIPGLGHLRSAGLLALDMIQPLKHKLARQALGMTGQTQPIRAWHEH